MIGSICTVYGLVPDRINNNIAGLLPVTRLMAVNADGTKPQLLSAPQSQYSPGLPEQDAAVIDWLPDQDGSVLMARHYLPNVHPESQVGSDGPAWESTWSTPARWR